MVLIEKFNINCLLEESDTFTYSPFKRIKITSFDKDSFKAKTSSLEVLKEFITEKGAYGIHSEQYIFVFDPC